MRILIHDFAGHAFALSLSRELASRGHEVRHLYCGKLRGPRGQLRDRAGDPPTLTVLPVEPRDVIDKQSLVRRRLQELDYGRRLVRAVGEFRPETILSGNAPLDAQAMLSRWCHARKVRFVFWLQDLIGVGAYQVLGRRWGLAGRAVGSHFRRLEGRLLRRSDAVVAITRDFLPQLDAWGVPGGRVRVIENWAPVGEVTPRPRDNPWARRHGLATGRVLLYSGTLGMKHDPRMLLELARDTEPLGDVRVVVISEGQGADWLARQAVAAGPANLVLLPYQPFAELPDVLASGDVLLALLEPEAGVYSVPSKVLSAMCAARPLLLAVPAENLAARLIGGAGAGVTVPPGDTAALAEAARNLLADPARRAELGRRGRSHAERHFRIAGIADAFEAVLAPVRGSG